MSEYEMPSMLDRLWSWLRGSPAPAPVPTPAPLRYPYSEDLMEFVKSWEGLKLVPSPDPLVPGVADVGYGHVLGQSDPKSPITRADADRMLREDLDAISDGVSESVRVVLAPYQFDALVSFAYNLGNGALASSTLMRKLNARDFDGAAEEFDRWCNANGVPVTGLRKRRAAERAMFESGDYSGRP